MYKYDHHLVVNKLHSSTGKLKNKSLLCTFHMNKKV